MESFFFFQAEDGIRDGHVTGVQTCALPICAGVGVDNIDLEAATEAGVIVVNAPDGNTNSAAEHTMAMLMALARKIPQAFYALKQQRWDRKSHVGVELKNKTLGVVGLGRIGAEVKARAKGQGMNVIEYTPFFNKENTDLMVHNYLSE